LQAAHSYIALLNSLTDLRDDKQFFVDHPGAVPITTAQVWLLVVYCPFLL